MWNDLRAVKREIGTYEISMNNVYRMKIAHCQQQLEHDVAALLVSQSLWAMDLMMQCGVEQLEYKQPREQQEQQQQQQQDRSKRVSRQTR
jgi:hypothetical protein